MSFETSSTPLPTVAEAVVIGGGVNGLSAAYQLTRKGIRPVVLERSHIGAGATGKSGALVRAHYSNPEETQLALASMRIFRDWDEQVGAGDPGLEPVGFLRLVAPEDEDALRKNVAMQRELGSDTTIVTRDEVAVIEPFIATDDITVAAYEPSSGFADSNATAFGFAKAAVDGAPPLYAGRRSNPDRHRRRQGDCRRNVTGAHFHPNRSHCGRSLCQSAPAYRSVSILVFFLAGRG